MEVPGKKDLDKHYGFSCKPCEARKICSQPNGYCTDCEEYMCTRCFETHTMYKLNRGHTLAYFNEVPTKRVQRGDLEKCDTHLNEVVKFYCVKHEQVGCGDCMILEHKTCNVEYIEDKAKAFKDSSECQAFIKGPAMCQKEAKQLMASIENNKIQADDINEQFLQDVNVFREEIISHVNKMSKFLIEKSDTIKATDILRMDNLAVETKSLIGELNCLSELIEPKMKEPNQLFVCSVLQKHKLDRLKEQLGDIKHRNKIEVYELIKNNDLMSFTKGIGQLGWIKNKTQENKTEDKISKDEQIEETFKSSDSLPQAKPKTQLLQERQLICRNITVEEDCLTYCDDGRGDVGLFVDKIALYRASSFEIEIVSLGQRGTIVVGVVPKHYTENQQPGCGEYSAGYNTNDGLLYQGSDVGDRFGPKCIVGDRIGFKLTSLSICKVGMLRTYIIQFTRNGRKIGHAEVETYGGVYAAVGMHSPGEKVKILELPEK
ncbi:uncharacterized protein LOC132757403 [Ruditapes philippinarum]|uniref:uncharacterized protein LOC132757403 n=1 Tax=Ruditapes philippinarum TaxID=129788 RepID=UPI00295B7060|nr:uncharacterized protein LOC132757403 [Ruditapes philippinarum]